MYLTSLHSGCYMIFCLNFSPLYKNTQTTTNNQTPKTKCDFETTATESYTFLCVFTRGRTTSKSLG